jgi:hypothetical protein
MSIAAIPHLSLLTYSQPPQWIIVDIGLAEPPGQSCVDAGEVCGVPPRHNGVPGTAECIFGWQPIALLVLIADAQAIGSKDRHRATRSTGSSDRRPAPAVQGADRTPTLPA